MRKLSILLLCSVAMFATVSADVITQNTVKSDITSYSFIGGLMYKQTDGIWHKQTVVGMATKINGPIWGIVRGSIGQGEESIEAPEISYWTSYKSWRFGILASVGASWQGDEPLVTYLTTAAGFSGGYIDSKTNKGVIAYARYKEGGKGFIDGVRFGAAFVF